MKQWPVKQPEESIVAEFYFGGELAAIDAATVVVTPVSGADPAAASMLIGMPQITGTSVFQRIASGLDKMNYRTRCIATQGQDVRVRSALLPVRFS